MNKLIFLVPVLAGALWGAVGIFVRKMTAFGLNSHTILSSRAIIGTLVLFIGIYFWDKSLLKIKLKDLGLFVAGGLFGMLGLNFCYNAAINQLTLSLAAVLLSLSPIFVIFLAAVFFKEKITVRKTSCMIMAILGCLFASGILENSASMKWSSTGIVIGVLSAIFYALYSVFSKIAMGRGYQAATITFYSFFVITIVLLPFTDWGMLREFVLVSPLEHSIFMFTHSVFASILPYILYTIALVYIDTGKVSILAAGGEPLAAVIFGLIFFAEVPTIFSMMGIILTIIALSVLCMPEKNKV